MTSPALPLPSPAPVTSDHARRLLARNAELARRMGDLALDAADVATALASRGGPAPEAFVLSLTEVGRLFTDLRAEAFAAAAALELPLPPLQTVDSTTKLETMLGALLATVEAAERQAARAAALGVLDRVARLTHRETPDFEPLRVCQETARKVRIAVADSPQVDAEAIAPFAALLEFIDSYRNLDDDQWGGLQETVSAAFGLPLATAAGRGRLVDVS